MKGVKPSNRVKAQTGMRAVTLSVAEELYEQARVIAAQWKTTLRGWYGNSLYSLSDVMQRLEEARREILMMIRSFDAEIGRMPAREEPNALR